jgi:hypothetical protein
LSFQSEKSFAAKKKAREKMAKKCFVLLCLLIAGHASPIDEGSDHKKAAGTTTYDQRQTGKYNVHLSIKDVQFFSLSDSLASIGGEYPDYGDYGTLEGYGENDTDYDAAHLTVNPLFAFLGAKPATQKPTTTAPATEKNQSSSEAPSISTTIQPDTSTTEKAETTTVAAKQDSESEVKASSAKPAPAGDKKPSEAIDYEEIPVEVQYYRANHQKLPSAGRQAAINRFRKRQPSVQIIDGYGRTNNVKILESDHPTVRICGRGEFRDNLGRCRTRTRRGVPGL